LSWKFLLAETFLTATKHQPQSHTVEGIVQELPACMWW